MSHVDVLTPTPWPNIGSAGRHPRAARLLAHLRAPWLDRQLAAGVASWHSPTHAARALQLTSARNRTALARSLERLVEQAEEPPTPARSAVIEPCRPQVREARPIILTMAFRLRSRSPVAARGMARLKLLLSDGVGPCYAPSRPDALAIELQTVSQWLDVRD
jgi:hypothetical protein